MTDNLEIASRLLSSLLIQQNSLNIDEKINYAVDIADKLIQKRAEKAVNVPQWNSSITYDKPAYVYYEGKVCVITRGLSKPVPIPQ